MIVDFLALPIPETDLAAALRVLRAFKECESREEWFGTMFAAWAKLEQLEEFLAHRVEGKELEDDTREALARQKKRPKRGKEKTDGL